MECGQPVRLGGLANEPHACFFGRPSALLVIATETGRDDVIPSLQPAAGNGYDMIKGQVFGRKFFTAVLARVIIAGIDVRARKFDSILIFYTDVLEQTNDR